MQHILEAIRSDKPKKIILDTDAYNEVDDQFAIAYAMYSADRIELLSVNAAPFLNERSTSAAEGMEKSYHEAVKLIRMTDPDADIPVYRGSDRFMTDCNVPVESEAADNIIRTALVADEPIYVVAIGAITNVASALLKCPQIAQKIIVIWLGGNILSWRGGDMRDFNLKQDIPAAQVVYDSPAPFIQIPCFGGCEILSSSVAELQHYLGGKNSLCDYLVDIVADYRGKPFAWSKVIWDIAAIALFANPSALDCVVLPRPILTVNGYAVTDTARPPFIYVRSMNRDAIFADLFTKLTK